MYGPFLLKLCKEIKPMSVAVQRQARHVWNIPLGHIGGLQLVTSGWPKVAYWSWLPCFTVWCFCTCNRVDSWHLYRCLQALPTAPAEHQAALQQLCLLYGIACLDRGSAFWLASSTLSGQDVKVISDDMRAICRELVTGPNIAALTLCEGFGIPDHCLQAPIAFDWKKI